MVRASMDERMAKRAVQLLILLVVSWCVMAFVHEAGHILCGWSCGGRLSSADLLPWHLPYSLFDPDPHPLVTLWGGPILGVAIPLVVAILLRRNWMWFIAYFCMLANGIYLAMAWVAGDRYLDTTRLLQQGAHPMTIALYCVLTIGFGYVGFRRHCLLLFQGRGVELPSRRFRLLNDDKRNE